MASSVRPPPGWLKKKQCVNQVICPYHELRKGWNAKLALFSVCSGLSSAGYFLFFLLSQCFKHISCPYFTYNEAKYRDKVHVITKEG
jgi:hypothetical protein